MGTRFTPAYLSIASGDYIPGSCVAKMQLGYDIQALAQGKIWAWITIGERTTLFQALSVMENYFLLQDQAEKRAYILLPIHRVLVREFTIPILTFESQAPIDDHGRRQKLKALGLLFNKLRT